ncbi:MAG: helicase-related protein, partial [Myxococcota bacterium]
EHRRSKADRTKRLIEMLKDGGFQGRRGSKAIVYCSTRKATEAVADALQAEGFAARHYHAGRTKRERERAQHAFGVGRLRILVATSAFGMGIDFPDVRLVVHYQSPGSLEAYFQEAGRAGRDGDAASCVLFFGAADMQTQRRLISGSHRGAGEALRAMEAYAHADRCREQLLCEHFGMAETPPCGRCDVCLGDVSFEEDAPPPPPALGEEALATIVAAVGGLTRPVGKTALARALRGSRAKALNKGGLLRLPEHGALKEHEERAIVSAIETCLSEGRLAHRGNKYPTVWIPGKPVRSAKAPGAVPRAAKKKAPKAFRRAAYSPLQGALERFRKRKARELKWKPYMVFQKRTISALDETRPSTLDELHAIPGLGHSRIERFGEDLLRLIRENP